MRKDLHNAGRAIPEELVQLAVKTAGGGTFFAHLLEVDGRGAQVRFEREGAPSFALGHPATLAFRSPRFQKPVELRATAVSRVESQAARGYGFRFERTQDLEATLQSIFSLINQRHAHRVRPRMTESVSIVLGMPDAETSAVRSAPRSAKGILRDISLSGLAVSLPAEVDGGFAGVESVSLTLSLPGSTRPIRVRAWVRNRRLDDEKLVYGTEFDAERSDDFDERHKEIVEYVMRRQREQLRVRAGRR